MKKFLSMNELSIDETVALNKISRIFIFSFFETSNIICTSFFLPRKIKCCLSLNTTYRAIMKSFFEGRKGSFVSISCE